MQLYTWGLRQWILGVFTELVSRLWARISVRTPLISWSLWVCTYNKETISFWVLIPVSVQTLSAILLEIIGYSPFPRSGRIITVYIFYGVEGFSSSWHSHLFYQLIPDLKSCWHLGWTRNFGFGLQWIPSTSSRILYRWLDLKFNGVIFPMDQHWQSMAKSLIDYDHVI